VKGHEIEMTAIIQARGLVKSFGQTKALAGVDLEVQRGQVFALLGPNGAGKTTIVRVLSTLLKPDGGQASVCGYDVVQDAVQVRQLLALTGQYASVDDELTGSENLIMIGRLLGFPRGLAKSRSREMLEQFDLSGAGGRAVKTYSGGMRRRLDLAASLLGDPDVLFLDEPTTGLDPRARLQMWDTVRAVVAAGATVLLTTQYLEEADELADQIAVIDRGQVVASGTPEELKTMTGSQTLAVRAADRSQTGQVTAAVAEITGADPDVRTDTGLVMAPVSDPSMAAAVVRRLDDAGIAIAELTLRLPSLDEVFLTLTGHLAEDENENENETDAVNGRAA
jgi:oleandomycin transport system ATP-binding protein